MRVQQLLRGGRRTDVHHVLLALGELDGASLECKQGVIPAAADVLARCDVRAALTNEDLALLHCLATKTLGAETLTAGIAAVARGAAALLMLP